MQRSKIGDSEEQMTIWLQNSAYLGQWHIYLFKMFKDLICNHNIKVIVFEGEFLGFQITP